MSRGVRGCPDPGLPLGDLLRPGRGGKLEGGKFGDGALGGGLEGWLAARLPGRHLTLCANARAGIRQACDRLGLVAGDEILAPAYNCGSEIDPLLHAGLAVRLYPVDAATRVSVDDLAARIGPRTRAIYLTHYFGRPQPEVAAIAALARARELALIEDCALALMSDAPEGPVGGFGDAAVFCLYKFLPLIGGGALALRGDLPPPRFTAPTPRGFEAKALARDLSRRVLGQGGARQLRARLRGAVGRAAAAPVSTSPVSTSPVSASPVQAGSLPDMPAHYYFDPAFRDARISGVSRRLLARADPAAAAAIRRRNHAVLAEALRDVPGVVPLHPDLPEGTAPLNFPVLLDPARRDAVCTALQAEGVAAAPWWSGYHQGLDWSDPALAPARALKDRGLALPLHQHLGPEQLRAMAATLGRLMAAEG